MYSQLEYGHLFIEKRNTRPNRIRRIHNVLLGGEEFKNLISTLIVMK